MRRITWWLLSTVAAVVLLFSYRTSAGTGVLRVDTAAVAAAPGIVDDPTATPSASSTAATSSQSSTPSRSSTPSQGSTSSRSSRPSQGSTTAPRKTTTATPSKSVLVNGTVSQTRWGPVQVQVRITNRKIVSVTAIQHPNDNPRDEEINAYALPQLEQMVLSAQSANIDTVSGATVTSDGYLSSLQAALDSANFTG